VICAFAPDATSIAPRIPKTNFFVFVIFYVVFFWFVPRRVGRNSTSLFEAAKKSHGKGGGNNKSIVTIS
jgi:hypothetical protein